jgi:ATP-binding cassette subfamily B protein RaxB
MNSYLQSTASECGICCLGFVADHHGFSAGMAELRAKFSISIRGTNLNDLVRIANSIGLLSRPLKLELDELKDLSLPCILHWNLNHFVVLTRIQRKKITVYDPARGEVHLSHKEMSDSFTGVAIELTPTDEFKRLSPKPPVAWRHLVGKVSGLKRSLVQLFFLAASLQLLTLLTPLFTQWTVDGAIVSGDIDLLLVLILGLGLITVIRVGMEIARGWLGIVLSTQFSTQWCARVMRHLIALPSQWFEVRHTGDVVSRFQSAQSIQQTVTGKLIDIFLDGLFSIVTLIAMCLYSPKLAVVVILAIIFYACVRTIPHSAFHRANDEVLALDAKAQTHFLESLRAIQTIKLFGLEDQRTYGWINALVKATNRRVTTQKMAMGFSTAYSLIFGVESLTILGLGAAMAIDGSLTVGMLMAFISYKDEFSSRMQRFVDNFMSMRMLSLHVERLSDIVLAEKEIVSGSLPENLDAAGWLESSIKLENIGFRYGDNGPWILRNLTLEIKANEHVAVVGPTGCGKTTLAKLILGLLAPTEGKIIVGGLPLEQIGLANWRRHIGAVMQDDQLFSGNLHENITSFDDRLCWEKIHASAESAAIHDEIAAMPMGYFTLNGDMGSSLSGGQKQRLLLARALYRQPRVLVLDEATSHLDVAKERKVNEAIRNLNITRIAIAHRPETIAMADRVVDLSAVTQRGVAAV